MTAESKSVPTSNTSYAISAALRWRAIRGDARRRLCVDWWNGRFIDLSRLDECLQAVQQIGGVGAALQERGCVCEKALGAGRLDRIRLEARRLRSALDKRFGDRFLDHGREQVMVAIGTARASLIEVHDMLPL